MQKNYARIEWKSEIKLLHRQYFVIIRSTRSSRRRQRWWWWSREKPDTVQYQCRTESYSNQSEVEQMKTTKQKNHHRFCKAHVVWQFLMHLRLNFESISVILHLARLPASFWVFFLGFHANLTSLTFESLTRCFAVFFPFHRHRCATILSLSVLSLLCLHIVSI